MKFKIIFLFITFIITLSCDNNLINSFAVDEKASYNKSDFNNREIVVTNVSELMATVYSTKEGNVTVLIKDGEYKLTDRLWLTGSNITYKSLSGNRDSVIIKGAGMNGNIGWIFSVAGSDFTVQDLSLGEVKYHGVQVHGELNADNINIVNVRFFNINQQMIKGSYNKSNTPQNHSDNGLIENCLFEYTSGIANQYYCGGVDIHHGENWVIRDNEFKNIKSPSSQLSEGAIHFWNDSKNITVERNKIMNCDRGIMFGFDNSPHNGGLIINNMIHTTRDTGIYLATSSDVKVYNITIYLDSNYKNAIEYRFSSLSKNFIKNNLTNGLILKRDGGLAEVDNNITNSDLSWFANVMEGDLHLIKNIDTVNNQGLLLNEVSLDIDKETRVMDKIDIGADELNI